MTKLSELSDIGTHVRPDRDSVTQFAEHWIYTKEERKELVFLAWSTAWRKAIHALEDYTYRNGQHPGGGESQFQKWMKEQGL